MLDSNAKIKDIINALQDMQGINQKEDFKSALVTKGVNVISTDNIAQLISKLNNSNLVLDGRKTAQGTMNISENNPIISINNLAFKPRIIIIEFDDSNDIVKYYIDTSSIFFNERGQKEYISYKAVGCSFGNLSNSDMINTRQFSNLIVSDNGISVRPSIYYSPSKVLKVYWLIVE